MKGMLLITMVIAALWAAPVYAEPMFHSAVHASDATPHLLPPKHRSGHTPNLRPHREHDTDHRGVHWGFGVMFHMLAENVKDIVVGHEAAMVGGGSLMFEVTFAPHIELEIEAGALGTPGALLVPIEMLLKVPFHPSPVISPFFALGPMMQFAANLNEAAHDGEAVHANHAPQVFSFGAIVSMGTAFWIAKHWAIELVFDSEFLYDMHQPQFALGFHTGIVWHS